MTRLLPEVLALRRGAGDAPQITLELHIPADIAHFFGHFPGLAILPGIVQIDWAVRFARAQFALDGEFALMENIKFQALVLPDARLELNLAWDAAKGRMEFAYATGWRRYSSGRIVFGGGA